MFDTPRYKKELSSLLANELGYKEEEFTSLFADALKQTVEVCSYLDPSFFLQEIFKVHRADTTLERLDEIFWNKDLYLGKIYQEVPEVLLKLRQRSDVVLAIHSTGDTMHQLRKIEPIRDYFVDENLNIFTNKIANLKNTLEKYRGNEIIVVDDVDEVLLTAQRISTDVKTVLVQRSNVTAPKNTYSKSLSSFYDIIAL